MSRVLIIGCGGVARVAIAKCTQVSDVFSEIMIASRTKKKCDELKKELEAKTTTKIQTAQVDADNVEELVQLIERCRTQCCLAISGFDNYAGLLEDKGRLHRHSKL